MQPIRVAAGVLNQIPLDWEGNRRRILEAIRIAKADDVGILCLPELAITGHGCEDAFQSADVQRRSLAMLEDVARVTDGLLVAVGLPLRFRKALYDVVALVGDGRVHGVVAKRFLAGDGLYYEPRWFKPWPARTVVRVPIGGHDVPMGDLVFECGGVRIGFEICEDAWVSHRPGSDLAARGIDVLLNPSASHFAFGKHSIRRRFVLEGSRAFAATYVYSNLLGNEAGRMIFDGGALIASGGEMIAAGPRLGFEEVSVTAATVDVERTRLQQIRTASDRPDVGEHPGDPVLVGFRWPAIAPAPRASRTDPGWEATKLEEFTRALALALHDYQRKSRSRGFVVSISGGADSAAVSVLVALSIRFAWAALGREVLLERLGSATSAGDVTTVEDLVGRCLLCVYQATRNSSEATRSAAAGVARGIGAQYREIDVDELVAAYTRLVEGAEGRTLSWERDDLALQNIQARVRAPGIWMLANLRNALLLATSNRSEAAVGYATMDGDTCGGLSPIAGIDKAFLREWLAWVESDGPAGFGPVPAVGAVNRLQPTAELRPPDRHQTDEEDLMPYPILDRIERAAIRDKQSPLDVWRRLCAEDPGADPRVRARQVERFFRLWARNQWKRERYAPSFHVDDQNLDPKTWCRFPILSGGFVQELEELRRAAETSG